MEIANSNAPASRQNRPPSHKWAIFVFTMFIIVNTWLMILGARHAQTIALLALSGCALVGSIFFSRGRGTYYVAAAALFLIVLRGVYYGAIEPAYQLAVGSPAAQQGWLAIIFQLVFILLLFRLLFAYILGKPSRRFFGFEADALIRE